MVLRVTNTDPNAKDELIGQQVGASYTIMERLGSGGMGLVYLAESTKIGGSTKIRGKVYRGKVVAVKVLTARSNEAIARFRAEAYAAGKVDKFSVVDILDAGELATGQSYILMEYCDGGSLQDLLEERGTVEFSYDEILSILSPVCAALIKAHEANLVHRDIKPANILFVKNGKVLRARLSDFGLVKLREHDMFLMTARNAVMGTPGFMSPEQCVDTANVDGRSDIYSVGCVLYLLLTGRLPYLGTMHDLIRQAKENAPIAPPSAFRRKLPPGWEPAAMRCLAFRREDRFQDALELINSLADGLENGRSLMGFHAPILVEDIALGPAANTVTSAAGGPAAKVWTNAQSVIQQRERSLRRRSLAMFIAGVAVGAVATGTIALTRSAVEADAPHIALSPVAPVTRAAPAPTSAAPEAPVPAPAIAHPAASSSSAHIASAPAPDSSTPSPSSATATMPPPPAPAPTHPAVSSLPTPAPAHPAVSSIPTPAPVIARPAASSIPTPTPAPTRPAVSSPAAPHAAEGNDPRASLPSVSSRDTTSPISGPSQREALPPDKPRPMEKEKRTQQAVTQGTLRIDVQPWADVVIGDWQDTTPVTRQLPAGHHRVVLKKGKQTETVDVVIVPNQTTTITRSW